MAEQLNGRRVAILATDGVERVELEQPRRALDDAGANTELLSIHDGEIVARNHDLDDAGTFSVDGLVSDASVDGYDALLLPGGTVNPDKLRMDETAVAFVRDFVNSDLPAFYSKIVEEFAEGRQRSARRLSAAAERIAARRLEPL
jgi:protease I